MCTFKQNRTFSQFGSFLQIAVSNWGLYNFGCREGKKSLEGYADFLAGLVCGEQKCLHGNEKPDILIVREKQLTASQYVELFSSICQKVYKNKKDKREETAMLIPHAYPAAAWQTGCQWLHLSLPLFREYQKNEILSGLQIGTSVHSVKEAQEAQRLGAVYVLAGHIFSTDCKKGVPPRGMEFLEQVCASVTIPVYAIGGIHGEHMLQLQKTKAAGACRMSEYML